MTGVFRPSWWGPWPRPRRPVTSPPPVRAQSGTAAVAVTTTAQPVKVVAVGGTCAVGFAPTGTAGKRAPHGGLCTIAAAGVSVVVKRGVSTGTAVMVAAPGAAHSRVSRQSGTAGLALSGQVRISSGMSAVVVFAPRTVGALRRNVASSGAAVTMLVGTVAQRKVVAVGGTCAVGFAPTGTAGKRAPAPAAVAAWALVGSARFAARVRGVCAAGFAGTGRPTKRSVVTGVGVVIAGANGTATTRSPTGGIALTCFAPHGAGLRRAPTGGRSLISFSGRSFPVVPGPTVGTWVSPPHAVDDGPIAGSRIFWAATLDGGTLLIETSIDNGASWQPAGNGAPIARLAQGDTRTARTVLTRVILTRATSASPSPRLHRLEVGVEVDSSRAEVVPVGVFTLNDVEVTDSPRGLSIELAGADLSRRISRNRWEDTYIVAENTNYVTAIQDMIRNRLPDAVFNFASTARLAPRLFFGEQASNDPWHDAQEMAEAIGYELFFDARGICTLRPEPDPDVGDSVHEFEETARPTMLELTRRVTDENTYNKVIAMGEGSGLEVPVRATAIDDDPASPTYHLGRYGTVTLIVRSPMILTAAQAQDAADALLRRVKGATESVELSVIPMPAVEPGDVVTVARGRSKVQGRFLIDQLRIPLGADEAMRATGRRQRQ